MRNGGVTSIMSAEAAGDTTMQAHENGATDFEAYQRGTIAGAAAVVTEHIGIERMMSGIRALKATGIPTVKNALKIVSQQATAEGFEEVAEEVVDILSDFSIMKDKGEVKQYINSLEGTPKEKVLPLAQYLMQRLGTSFASGALLGAVMTGGGSINTTSEARGNVEAFGRGITEEAGLVTKLKEAALNLENKNSEAYKIAKSLENKQATSLEAGLLYNALEQNEQGSAVRVLEQFGKDKAVRQANEVLAQNGIYAEGQRVYLDQGDTSGIITQRNGDTYTVKTEDGNTRTATPQDIFKSDAITQSEIQKYIDPEVYATLQNQYELTHPEANINDRFINKVKEVTGLNVEYVNMPAEKEAAFDPNTNTVYLNRRNPNMSRNEFLTQKTSHELGHAIAKTEQYTDIKNTLLKDISQEELEQQIQNKIEQYESAGVLIDYDGALEEITSEELRKALIDPARVEQLLNNDAKFGNTILQKIKDILWQIRKMFSKGGKNSEAYKNYQAVRELEQMYKNVYDAVRNIEIREDAAQAASVQNNGNENPYTYDKLIQKNDLNIITLDTNIKLDHIHKNRHETKPYRRLF